MNNEKKRQLLDATATLLEFNQKAYDQYVYRTKQEGYQPDFYNEVKPFADDVLAQAEQWQTLALEWLEDEPVKYLHQEQITATFENLTMVSVIAFQKDTRKKRFNERIKSIEYVLESMLTYLKS